MSNKNLDTKVVKKLKVKKNSKKKVTTVESLESISSVESSNPAKIDKPSPPVQPNEPAKMAQPSQLDESLESANKVTSISIKNNLENLVDQGKEQINTLKVMTRLLNTLEKLYERNLKQIAKKSKKNKRRIDTQNRQPSGFAKPIKISDKLCKFYGVNSGTLVSRTDITRAITKHIKDNNLQVKENRRQFIPDKKLKSILSPLDSKKKDKNGLTDKQKGYTYFNVQKYISGEFIKN